jgi:hypothetical protein
MHLAEGLASLTLADWLGVTATIIAIIGIVLAAIFYKRSKSSKTLDYHIVSSQSLTTDEAYPGLELNALWRDPHRVAELDALDTGPRNQTPEMARELERLARLATRTKLESPSLHVVKVQNTGTLAIDEAEFKTPITIEIPGCQVVSVSIVESSVDGILPIGPIASDGPSETKTLTPRLMNQGDSLIVKVLADGGSPHEVATPVVSCWIVGQTRPMRRLDRAPSRQGALLLLLRALAESIEISLGNRRS